MQNDNLMFIARGTLKLCLVFLTFNLCFLIFVQPTAAEKISSDSYEIQMGNLNMGAGLPFSTSYKAGLTGGQISPGLYSSTGYKLCAGFWCVRSIIPFSFTLSNTAVTFGSLTPGSPSTLFTNLSVSSGGAGGYQVTARESDQLKTITGANFIPDTVCDSGCDIDDAKAWTNNSVYGFGYNMSGNDVPADFTDSTYYRPFASIATGDNPAVIMSNTAVGRNRMATITYKINISGSQAAGNYENYIVFVATPTY